MLCKKNEVDQADESPENKKPRVFRNLVILLGIVIVLTTTGTIGIYSLIKDESPPQDDDLYFVRQELPEDQNAFNYLELARAQMNWPEWEMESGGPFAKALSGEKTTFTSEDFAEYLEAEKTRQKSPPERLDDILKGQGEWDDELVKDFLSVNEECFRLWEEGLSIGTCQAPEVTRINQSMDYLAGWREMARGARLRALNDMREGREQQAFDRAIDIMKSGQMLEDARGPMLPYLIALAVKVIGLQTTRELLAETTLSADELAPLVERIGKHESNREALADAYRVEYQITLNAIADLVKIKEGQYSTSKKRYVGGYLFKPNQTRRFFAEYYRWGITNAVSPRWEWETDPPEDIKSIHKSDEDSLRRTRWKPNVIGRTFSALIMPELNKVNDRACLLDWRVRATKVTIALRCYELETGELPDQLDALVPKYLEENPIDPFDGKSLRYSREERLIKVFDEEFMRWNIRDAVSIEIPPLSAPEEQASTQPAHPAEE